VIVGREFEFCGIEGRKREVSLRRLKSRIGKWDGM
jgi:hypothetical protein